MIAPVYCLWGHLAENLKKIVFCHLQNQPVWKTGGPSHVIWYTNIECFPCFYQETDAEERQTRGFKVGILTVVEDDVATTFSLPKVNSIDVVLEEAVVLRNLLDLPTAFAYLFGLLYALDIAFPKELKYTFEVIQKVLMELGTDCSQRVRSLKTKLLLWIW